MRALVLGGAGGMGQGVARDLIKQQQVTHVVLGDLFPDPQRLAPKLRDSEKTNLIKMDVSDHAGMVNKFKEIDVVINCAGPFYKTAVPVAKAAVEAKVNYIDICDDYEGTEILFNSEIDKIAREAGITVLTGMGSDPGTNNVLVKWYANRLDSVDDIYLYWVVAIAELAGAAWDHSLHMTLGKVPQYLKRSAGACGRRDRSGPGRVPGSPRHLPYALRWSSTAFNHPQVHQERKKRDHQRRTYTNMGG